jgi:hypothetical protein
MKTSLFGPTYPDAEALKRLDEFQPRPEFVPLTVSSGERELV